MRALLRDPLFIVIATAIVNGLVTWGVVQTKLEYLARDVAEAKADAKLAHSRIDQVILRAP